MIPQWYVQLFGGLAAARPEGTVNHFRTQKTAELFAYLARHLTRAHQRDFLIELIWPEADVSSGRNSLSIALWALRRQLEPGDEVSGSVLVADRHQVRLNPEAVRTDVGEFDSAVRAARNASGTTARAAHLRRAAALYQGQFLPGVYEDWVLLEQQRLAQDLQFVLRELTSLCECGGDVAGALDFARQRTALDPWCEQAHQDIIRLLTQAEHPNDALRHYREFERRLREELNTFPPAATVALARQIEQCRAGVSGHAPGLQPVAERGPAYPRTVTLLLGDTSPAGTAAQAPHLAGLHGTLRQETARFAGSVVPAPQAPVAAEFGSASAALSCAMALLRQMTPVAAEASRLVLDTFDTEAGASRVPPETEWLLGAAGGGQLLCGETTAVLLRRAARASVQLIRRGERPVSGGGLVEPVFEIRRARHD